ncbi:hypothetical protein [Mesorhizobium sp. J8]|uniref:hypothetical protein n=1 Tax=Mesorhizobium sp. J8 TaxID=2777475 RepID=UPI001915E6AD|nr:hypothetical protein [Mesorhizobium sp. J8]BCM19195.1 hypothetical protein MJ8_29670 [Mesorhizobium sp. J8]
MAGWTPTLVKNAMVHAFEVLLDTTGQVGPDWFKNNWPEYRVEFSDEVNQHQEGAARTVTRVRVQRTARDSSRMEKVLIGDRGMPNWGRYVEAEPAARRAPVTWCFWAIRGRHTEVECQRRGWAYSTFRRRRDKAAALISTRLNAAGVVPW